MPLRELATTHDKGSHDSDMSDKYKDYKWMWPVICTYIHRTIARYKEHPIHLLKEYTHTYIEPLISDYQHNPHIPTKVRRYCIYTYLRVGLHNYYALSYSSRPIPKLHMFCSKKNHWYTSYKSNIIGIRISIIKVSAKENVKFDRKLSIHSIKVLFHYIKRTFTPMEEEKHKTTPQLYSTSTTPMLVSTYNLCVKRPQHILGVHVTVRIHIVEWLPLDFNY